MIGIIGGTGLYAMRELGTPRTRTVSTPFGAPSAPLVTGTLHGREVAFLARHGLQHQLLPGEINFRANIWALKNLGVRTVIGVSAVGSLRAEIHPGELGACRPGGRRERWKRLRAMETVCSWECPVGVVVARRFQASCRVAGPVRK